MLIKRKSMTSGVERTIDLPITDEQVAAYNNGALLQNAFPNLTDAQREFYKTGITDEEWREIFDDDEDDGTPPVEECKRDLDLYVASMKTNNIDACIAIEKKYGCYGMPPQRVTEELSILAEVYPAGDQ